VEVASVAVGGDQGEGAIASPNKNTGAKNYGLKVLAYTNDAKKHQNVQICM